MALFLGLLPDEKGFYTIGDMMLSKQQTLDYFGLELGQSGRSGIPNKSYRWPNGELPYQFDPYHTFTKKKHWEILDSIDEFNSEMDGCLRIV